MGTILCATRGGEASYRTQDAAIALAKEGGQRLLFLYIVDMCFLDRTSRAVRPDVVKEEIARMGEFLLDIAQERAAAQGVKAERQVRYGTLKDELKAAAQKEDVDLVLLGRPAGEESAFQMSALETFAAELADEIDAEVRVV
ncbi:MAG: universal stress protein [Anaerolineae bacterium]|jgi:nucleotide-binding universal stress UspA family protein